MQPFHLRIDEDEALHQLEALAELWETNRPTLDQLPARRDLSPKDLANWMGYLAIYEVEPGEPFRLRTRLMGTHIVEADQSEHTGRFIDEYCPAGELERVFDAYIEAWRTRKPTYRFRRERTETQRECWAMKLVLPLANDGASIDMFLVALYMGFPYFGDFDRSLLYV